jgi:hypothetical protein
MNTDVVFEDIVVSVRQQENRSVDMDVVNAWLEAAQDLGVRVTAPFTLTKQSGDTETFEALIYDFGGPKGTITGRVIGHRSDSVKSRSESGYYASNLADSYRRYDRALFTATLDDWKWFGKDEDRPAWYTGRAWGR